MGRTAAHGLSKHATKGYRISIGKKPDGGYRTFWLGHSRVVAEYHADALKAQFEHMRDAQRDVWTDADVERVTWHVREFKNVVAATHERHRHNVAQLNRTGAVINAALADEEATRRPVRRAAVEAEKSSPDPAQRNLTLHAAKGKR